MDLRLEGSRASLRSRLTRLNDLPRQDTFRGELDLSYGRRWQGESFGRFLGAALAGRAVATVHFYDDPAADDVGFGMFLASLGPVAGVERKTGPRHRLGARARVPLLALAGRSYGDLRLIPRGGLPFRLVTVTGYQALDLTLDWRRTARRADLVLGYRVEIERLRDPEPYRFARQAAFVMVGVRL